ncbi:MAG: FG-GAP-like repeat-containing protein [Saprospiraceae bacterium]|nr:FG-GAP-like repeat-containing protein [Saprospiraceae bacterium]
MICLLCAHHMIGQVFTDAGSTANLDDISSMNGVAVADYDRDGDLDIYFSGFLPFIDSVPESYNRLMRNDGNGTFTDVTLEAGFISQFTNPAVITETGVKLGVSWGDFDNDGYPDLYLTHRGGNQLYRNEGDGTFEDVTESAGVIGCLTCYNAGGLWWDHDRDGDLDLYVSILDGPNILYENNGDGTFSDRTNFYKLGGAGITWTSVALDVGKDGFLDLYNANDTQINEFFENRTGTNYVEASRAYRLADEGAGMGLAIGDYNNDGFFDIYVTNIFNHKPNPLFKNLGNRRFENQALEMGVSNAGWGWGTKFFDCDHDGDEDLYVVTGTMDKQYINQTLQEGTENYFFKNTLMEGSEGFVDWSAESQTAGSAATKGRGLEVFDYDGDGDLDMLVANIEEPPQLYRNEVMETGESALSNWIQISLEGTESNRSAFGTEVKITIGDRSYYRWHHGSGFYGQSVQPVHFGLADADKIDEIQITWPLGLVQKFEDISANQLIQLTEGSTLTDVDDQRLVNLPFRSKNQYPNPFIEEVNFQFEFTSSGLLQLQIYSVYGELIEAVQYQINSAGPIQLQWKGKDEFGDECPPGTYFFVAHFQDHQQSGRLVKF